MPDLIAQGLTNRQIGARLFIAERTVDTHVGRILAKLGCSSRAQVAAIVTAAAAVTIGTAISGPGRPETGWPAGRQPVAGLNTHPRYALSPTRDLAARPTVST